MNLTQGRCDECEAIKLTEAGLEYVRTNFMADVSKRSFAKKHDIDAVEELTDRWTNDLGVLICKHDISTMLRAIRFQLEKKIKQRQGKQKGGAYWRG